MTSDLLAEVRARTREMHDALEGSGWLDSALADFDAFASHIARLGAYHRAIARGLAPFACELRALRYDAGGRSLCGAVELETDRLQRRGTFVPIVCDAQVGPLRNVSEALGCAYVVEGSQLGGMLIGRAVRERLGWSSSVYCEEGAAVAAAWRSFRATVADAAAMLEPSGLVTGARAAFSSYASSVAGPALAPAGAAAANTKAIRRAL